jgi:hypothetical protein
MKKITIIASLLLTVLAGIAQLGLDSSAYNPYTPNANPAEDLVDPNSADNQILQYGNPAMNAPGNGNGNGIGNGNGNGLDNNPNAPIDPGPDPGIPVDGGLLLLAAAGTAYGARKVWKQKQPK